MNNLERMNLWLGIALISKHNEIQLVFIASLGYAVISAGFVLIGALERIYEKD